MINLDYLTNLVANGGQLTFTAILVAIAVSMILGGLHALTPGHGKTIVAAYLVGSKGTVKHAMLLGMIVTIAHTGSILLLGMLALTASRFFMPEIIMPVMELISAAIILVLGLFLVVKRFGEMHQGSEDHHHGHDHDHHGHSHDDHNHAHDHPHEHSHSESVHEHHHHNIDLSHSIVSKRKRTMTHSHGGTSHSHEVPQDLLDGKISLKSLIALGVSGGIVPCPDALALMLLALSLNRVVLGMSILLAFSVGLAAVLVGIGIAVVKGKGIFLKGDTASKIGPVVSFVSAIIVTLLGTGMIVLIFAKQHLAQKIIGMF